MENFFVITNIIQIEKDIGYVGAYKSKKVRVNGT